MPEPGLNGISPCHVVVLRDDAHSFSHVVHLLMTLFGHARPAAEALADRVAAEGRAVVLITHREHAELKCEQIREFDPGPPIGCVIEPAG